MVINSGLILKARRAAELQGVIGHEIAHVTQQHGVRAVIRSTSLFVVAQALLGDASGIAAVLANAGPMLIFQAYSRDFEREADREGLALLRRARIDPHGMVDFFRLILAEEKRMLAEVKDENARKVMEASRAFLGTHPETTERIDNLAQAIAREPAGQWRNDEAPFRALQDAVRIFVAETGQPAAPAANTEPATAP
jgi:predicted Zn-dependent protease